MEEIKKAEQIAREAHKGQTRWDKTPYINHPKRVVMTFYDTEIDYRIVSWLHDVIEDTNITAKDLINKGISVKLVNVITILSKTEDENYFDYIMRVSKDPIATRVKIADINDNMADGLKEGSMKDKYRLARYILRKVRDTR